MSDDARLVATALVAFAATYDYRGNGKDPVHVSDLWALLMNAAEWIRREESRGRDSSGEPGADTRAEERVLPVATEAGSHPAPSLDEVRKRWIESGVNRSIWADPKPTAEQWSLRALHGDAYIGFLEKALAASDARVQCLEAFDVPRLKAEVEQLRKIKAKAQEIAQSSTHSDAAVCCRCLVDAILAAGDEP